jgi:hypothetical protein
MKQSDWFQVPSSSSFVPIHFRFAFNFQKWIGTKLDEEGT